MLYRSAISLALLAAALPGCSADAMVSEDLDSVTQELTDIGSGKAASYKAGKWAFDESGDGIKQPHEIRPTKFGTTGDVPLLGDWYRYETNCTTGGRQKMGVYRPSTKVFYLDFNDDGIATNAEAVTGFIAPKAGFTDVPFVFRRRTDSTDGRQVGCRDVLGIFRAPTSPFVYIGEWFIDSNFDMKITSADLHYSNFGQTGDIPTPLSKTTTYGQGSMLAVYRPSEGRFFVDTNGNGGWDGCGGGVNDTCADWGAPGSVAITNQAFHKFGSHDGSSQFADINSNFSWDGDGDGLDRTWQFSNIANGDVPLLAYRTAGLGVP